MALFNTKAKHTPRSTQAYLDIAAIKDGVLILKSGGMRAVLMVTSVNFALKSPEEQEDIVLRYQGFLNSLHFPIQIVMQSRKLDLTDYLARLRERSEAETNEQIRTQIVAYVEFMERLLSVANIMDKQFFVVVPFDPTNLATRGLIDKLLHPAKQVTISMTEKEFTDFAKQLDERVNLMLSGLSSMGLKAGRLDTKQLIELFYSTYNPEEAVKQRLTDVTQLQQQFIGDAESTTPAADATAIPEATNG